MKPALNVDLHRYTLTNYIGEGAFGQVFLCKDRDNGRTYAIKVQSKEAIDEQGLLRFATSEQRILRRASGHPFIVKLKESFQNKRHLFLVLEYCPCGNLQKIIKQQPHRRFTEDQARRYICQIILGLEHLHSLNILYRDLKPENILVDLDGNVKLTDFGLSKEIVEDFYHSRSFVGTHAYLAPEILQRRPHGKSIDWYGIGAILYEFLIGIPPYFDPDKDRLYENIITGALKIPRGRMSTQCLDLIKSLLKRDPLARLGANKGSIELKQHPWFSGVDWQEVYDKRVFIEKYKARVPHSRTDKANIDDLLMDEEKLKKLGRRIVYADDRMYDVEDWDFYNH